MLWCTAQCRDDLVPFVLTRRTSWPQKQKPKAGSATSASPHCPVGDARLNKVLGCFGPRVETDLPEHFAVLLGVHVVVPKGAISSKKVGCDVVAPGGACSASEPKSSPREASGQNRKLVGRQSGVFASQRRDKPAGSRMVDRNLWLLQSS